MIKDSVKTLAPIPGGSQIYLRTLHDMLDWIDRADRPTRRSFVKWVVTQYGVKQSSVSNYIHTLIKLNVVQGNQVGQLELLPLGQQYLDAAGEDRAQIVLGQIMNRYVGLIDILQICAYATGTVSLDNLAEVLLDRYKGWQTSVPVRERVQWLRSTGCLYQLEGRQVYKITAFGRGVYSKWSPDTPVNDDEPIPVNVGTQTHVVNEAENIIGELQQAALFSQMPHRFEQAIASAFRFLGFEAEVLGHVGTTDILVTAWLGTKTYTAVVDAKARRDGRLQVIEPYTLLEHRQKHGADFALIVAHDFADGKVARQADKAGITLLPGNVLCHLIRLQSAIPVDIMTLQPIFEAKGLMRALPESVLRAFDRSRHRDQLLKDLFDLVKQTQSRSLNLSWTIPQISHSLAIYLGEARYTESEVKEAVDFLSQPLLSCVVRADSDELVFAMDQTSLARRLQSISTALS